MSATIRFRFADLSATVIYDDGLSPDLVDTIVNDLRKQVVAGARQLGMEYTPTEPEAGDA